MAKSRTPKIPVLNIFYLLAYSWNSLAEAELLQVDVDAEHDVDNLCASILISGMRQLLKRGLDRSYVQLRETSKRPRGRIHFSDSLKHIQSQSGKLVCEFSDHNYDSIPNRVLVACLRAMTRNPNLTALHQAEIHKTLARLPELTSIDLNNSRVFLARASHNRQLYSLLLNTCQFYCNNILMNEESGPLTFRDFIRDTKRLRTLFEGFIRNFYFRKQDKFDCDPGSHKLDLPSRYLDISGEPAKLPKMEVDVLLKGKDEFIDEVVIIECKYTAMGLEHKSSREQFEPSSKHVFQLDAYLNNFQQTDAKKRSVEGILLYPTVTEQFESYSIFRAGRQKLSVQTINLNQPWQKIESDMLSFIGILNIQGQTNASNRAGM